MERNRKIWELRQREYEQALKWGTKEQQERALKRWIEIDLRGAR